MAHLFFGLFVEEIVDQLEGVLQFAGTVQREPRPQEREEHHDDRHHQQLHGDEIGPGPVRVGQPDQRRQRVAQTGKVIVEQPGNQQVLQFRAYTSSIRISMMTAATGTNRPASAAGRLIAVYFRIT